MKSALIPILVAVAFSLGCATAPGGSAAPPDPAAPPPAPESVPTSTPPDQQPETAPTTPSGREETSPPLSRAPGA